MAASSCHHLILANNKNKNNNNNLKGCVMVMADPSDLGHGKNTIHNSFSIIMARIYLYFVTDSQPTPLDGTEVETVSGCSALLSTARTR